MPADLDLLEVHSLALDESMLTGESVPVRPEPRGPAHAGTFVVEGEAEAEVTATGPRTRLAGIAALTSQAHRRPGPLALQLRRAVMIIAVIAVCVGVVFFGVAIGLGMPPDNGFLLAVGVTVALVPEGLLPTVTLLLARGAQQMARRSALVRRLESVETLGSTTYFCTDKTGTLTRNEMAVVEVWTPAGAARATGTGYSPAGTVTASRAAVPHLRRLAVAAVRSSTGRIIERPDGWHPVGDPMEAALSTFALRAGVRLDELSSSQVEQRFPFDPRRRVPRWWPTACSRSRAPRTPCSPLPAGPRSGRTAGRDDRQRAAGTRGRLPRCRRAARRSRPGRTRPDPARPDRAGGPAA